MLSPTLFFGFALVVLEPPPSDYERARAELAVAVESVNSDPETNLDQLDRALREIAIFPEQLIDDPATVELRTMAMLGLARGYSSLGSELALSTMDQAVREAVDVEIPIERFGPRARALYEERRTVLVAQGQATIAVECRVECQVYVDEHLVSNPSPPLLLGPRRVMVRAVVDELEWGSWLIALNEPGAVVSLVYPEVVEAEEPEQPPAPPPAPPSRVARGSAPLLASGGITLAGGIALAAFGVRWWARDTEFRLVGSEIHIVDYRTPGMIMTGIGVGGMAVGLTLFCIEALRARKQRDRSIALDLAPHRFGLTLQGRF